MRQDYVMSLTQTKINEILLPKGGEGSSQQHNQTHEVKHQN